MGGAANLTSVKDAHLLLASKPVLKSGLAAVLERRLARQTDLIDQGYDASLRAVRRLGSEHEKLEKEQALDLARVREIVAQLRTLVDLLGKASAG
jgi:hypothetical protein